MKFWYIGLNSINVNRADFDFEEGIVKIFSSTAHDVKKVKLLFVFMRFVGSIIMGIVVYCLVYCIFGKEKKKKSKDGYELLNQ